MNTHMMKAAAQSSMPETPGLKFVSLAMVTYWIVDILIQVHLREWGKAFFAVIALGMWACIISNLNTRRRILAQEKRNEQALAHLNEAAVRLNRLVDRHNIDRDARKIMLESVGFGEDGVYQPEGESNARLRGH